MTDAPGDRPTALVVDDEEDLRDIMRRMLERRGFSTLVAGDPDRALAVCRDHAGDIDRRGLFGELHLDPLDELGELGDAVTTTFGCASATLTG